jgi:hypothetical protein
LPLGGFEQQYNVNLPADVAAEFDGQPVVVARQESVPMHGVVESPRLPAENNMGTVNDLATATEPAEQSDPRGRAGAVPSAPIQEGGSEPDVLGRTECGSASAGSGQPPTNPHMEGENAQIPETGEERMLQGMFQELPAPGILRAEWGLSEDSIAELQDHEVYLNAVCAERAINAPGS